MNNNSNKIIVIPVYKDPENLSAFEVNTINNSILILSNYLITFIGSERFQESYRIRFPDTEYRTFPDKYFTSVQSYNKLLLSNIFYNEFCNYDFLVIIQTDAWIFKDSLSEFDIYDYVGAPWLFPPIFLERHNPVSRGLVGNGGFSMRNIQFCENVILSNNRLFTLREFYENIRILLKIVYKKRSFLKKMLIFFNVLYLFLFYNKLKFASKYYRFINEDAFFGVLSVKAGNYRIPSPEIASTFSIETFLPPKTDLEQIMGCHSFERRSKEFWTKRVYG